MPNSGRVHCSPLPANEVLEHFHHVPALGEAQPVHRHDRSASSRPGTCISVRRKRRRYLAEQHRGLYQFLLNKWYFDELYDFLFVRPAKWLGRFLWKEGDGRVIDGYGPNGIAARVMDVTDRVVRLQTGYLYHYAFVMLIGIAALVTWMMLGSSF